ncbi:hypothetical protein AAHC03_024554 [Spirometra sp. Aus1]|nr:unnamed protein product [Spirometra erinaceieuropaei]
MILIEPYHQAVRDVVLLQFNNFKEYRRTNDEACFPNMVKVTIADFDGVIYNISQDPKSTILTVSILLRFYKDIEKFGDSKVLAREYGQFLQPAAEAGYSVTLKIDYNKLPDNVEELATKVALLRRHCFASVFEHFFDYQMSKPSSTLQGIIHFRTDETMFVQAMSDRATVIFSTRFKDPGDMVLGKTFLQEFSEARRRFDGAPQVIYCHRDPPRELAGTDALSGDNIAYITFVLSPRHIDEKHRAKTIDLIHTLRTYLHYHIKCMKAYMQMRMRAKTSEFLKVLNRAHRETNTAVAVNVDQSSGLATGSSANLRALRMG